MRSAFTAAALSRMKAAGCWSLSRQQSADAFNGLATGLYQGLSEFVVALQIDCPGHDGRLEHAKIHAMYEHDVVRPVE